MVLYDSIFYGGGDFYGPTNTDVPQDLRFYRTNVDGVYVFHWGFLAAFITPLLTTYDFQLQIADEDTFTAPIVDVLSADVIHYQNGDVRKGYEVEVPARLDKIEQTLFARVRTKNGVSFSDWSYTLQFKIPQKYQVEEAENIVIAIPDYHVFGKEDLRKLVVDRVTNLYTVADTYGKELDQTLLENLLTTTNNYISLCRDEALYDNFGVLFSYPKPQTQEFVEYRECLRIFILSALVGGTIEALNATVRSFTGVNPFLELVRNRNDFFLSTIQENPPEATDGVRTFFSLSQNYIVNSLVVLKNGLVLTNGTDFTENHATPGFDMTVAPAPGDILQTFYQIGLASDPEPLVFDPMDTTALTGTATFTHNSFNILGFGTLFTTELVSGNTITDSTGLVLGVVDVIIDDTHLTLTQKWVGTTNTGSIKKLVYGEDEVPPSIMWDQKTLAYGVVIHVLNPGEFVLDQALMQQVIDPFIPAHVKRFWEFD